MTIHRRKECEYLLTLRLKRTTQQCTTNPKSSYYHSYLYVSHPHPLSQALSSEGVYKSNIRDIWILRSRFLPYNIHGVPSLWGWVFWVFLGGGTRGINLGVSTVFCPWWKCWAKLENVCWITPFIICAIFIILFIYLSACFYKIYYGWKYPVENFNQPHFHPQAPPLLSQMVSSFSPDHWRHSKKLKFHWRRTQKRGMFKQKCRKQFLIHVSHGGFMKHPLAIV